MRKRERERESLGQSQKHIDTDCVFIDVGTRKTKGEKGRQMSLIEIEHCTNLRVLADRSKVSALSQIGDNSLFQKKSKGEEKKDKRKQRKQKIQTSVSFFDIFSSCDREKESVDDCIGMRGIRARTRFPLSPFVVGATIFC